MIKIMEHKVCIKCNEEKSLTSFPISKRKDKAALSTGSSVLKKRDSNLNILYRGTCKDCCAIEAKAFRLRYKEKTGCSDYRGSGLTTQYPKEDRLLISAIRKRISQAKSNIKRKSGEFNLSEKFMYDLFKKQQGKCALSGVLMEINGNTNLRLSIDKIDHSKGYVESNVQWTVFAVNRAKGDLSNEDFIDMCKLIIERATTIERVTNRVE